MPYKDPEKKKAYLKEWHKKKIAQGYGAWLYKRRKMFKEDAAYFRQALEEISSITSEDGTRACAEDALDASEERWRLLMEERREIHSQ